jgi:hypothetical protein
MYDKQGNVIDSCPFIFNVELDELEAFNNVKLNLKPLDPCVVITRQYYEFDESEITDPYDFERLEVYENNFFYNDEDDKLVLNVFNGFDVALFNISSLLGIGRVEIADEVPANELGFAPVHDRVRTITWTLEEFKKLDGFVAWIKFAPPCILFKGLLIGSNYVHESVESDDRVPMYDSDVLLRGEKLFLLD